MREAAAAALLTICGSGAAAQAAWLHCEAGGSDSGGAFAYETTLADLGSLDAARLAGLEQRLVRYVGRTDTAARGVQAHCQAYADPVDGYSTYSRALSQSARRLGWDRVTVVAAADWLSAAEIVTDSTRP